MLLLSRSLQITQKTVFIPAHVRFCYKTKWIPSCCLTPRVHATRCAIHTGQSSSTSSEKQDAISIFNAAVASVLPHNMVKKTLTLRDGSLYISDVKYSLKNGVHVIAFGKAVLGMIRAAEDVLGDHIVGGVASIPEGMPAMLQSLGKWDLIPSKACRVTIKEGARNNIPDNNAFEAARMIEALLLKLNKDDVVLTFISGGGSALLPYPKPPVTLEDLAATTELLSRKGATIQQLNSIRKHLEKLKGGGIARAAYPAQMAALILSDVIRNDIEFIASGPTICNLEPPSNSLSLIKELGLIDQVPQSVLQILNSPDNRESMFHHFVKDLDAGDRLSACSPYDNVQTLLVGTNTIALEAARTHATYLGYVAVILTSTLCGSVSDAVDTFTNLIIFTCGLLCGLKPGETTEMSYDFASLEVDLIQRGIPKLQINEIRSAVSVCRNSGKSLCILAGGETTVEVKGHGLGGRNQEMALLLAKALDDLSNKHTICCSSVFLSAGTDGQDGPTDAAGAVVDCHTVTASLKCGLHPEPYLDNNDSYNFFKQLYNGSCHVVTGFTGTNVMDIQVLILKPH